TPSRGGVRNRREGGACHTASRIELAFGSGSHESHGSRQSERVSVATPSEKRNKVARKSKRHFRRTVFSPGRGGRTARVTAPTVMWCVEGATGSASALITGRRRSFALAEPVAPILSSSPTACAVGYHLSPLPGLNVLSPLPGLSFRA